MAKQKLAALSPAGEQRDAAHIKGDLPPTSCTRDSSSGTQRSQAEHQIAGERSPS